MALGPARWPGHHCEDPSAPPLVTESCHSCSSRHRLHSWLHGGKAPSALTASESQQGHCHISVPSGTALQHQQQLSEPGGECPVLTRGSAAIPEQVQMLKAKACKTLMQPTPHPCHQLVGSQACPSPGAPERGSAQALETLESREHWEHGQKVGSELNITAGKEDLPSPELTWPCPGIAVPRRGAAGCGRGKGSASLAAAPLEPCRLQ